MRRLNFESLEQRDMAAVAEFRANLLADCRGTPGPPIPSVHGSTFWLEITAEDVRDEPRGLHGISLDIMWDPTRFAVADPFHVPSIITDSLPGFAFGTLESNHGRIDDLTGSAAIGLGVGALVGSDGPERFAIIRFEVLQSGAPTRFELDGGMYDIAFFPPIWDQPSDFVFGSLSVEVKPHREYGPDFIGPLPADVYFGMDQECFK